MSSDAEPTFRIGQIVRHLRYHYRGVIYDFDESCQADESWYQNNKTQPARDQPWYHVLVDGHGHTTYVAQSNLEPDTNIEPVTHPHLNKVFECYQNGRYLRRSMN